MPVVGKWWKITLFAGRRPRLGFAIRDDGQVGGLL
jgi:hypothetical protein